MGAGAGYNVTIKGIELDNRNWKILSDDYDERYDSHTVQVEIPVKPCVAEYWDAEAYYEGIDSNYDLYDGNWDNQIDGGTAILQLEVYPPQWIEGDIMTSEELDEAVGELLPSTLNLTMVYGGGWSHTYLPEEGIVFDDDNGRINLDEGETYDYTTVRCELKCPNIIQNINAFFKNPEAYYDEDGMPQYPEEDDDEIVNSRKPIKSSGSEEWFGIEMIYDQLSEYFRDYGFDNVNFEGITDTKARVEFRGWHEYDIDQFYKDITNISHYFSNEVVPIWFTMDVMIGGSCELVVNVEKPV